jgi:hypothetical protein
MRMSKLLRLSHKYGSKLMGSSNPLAVCISSEYVQSYVMGCSFSTCCIYSWLPYSPREWTSTGPIDRSVGAISRWCWCRFRGNNLRPRSMSSNRPLFRLRRRTLHVERSARDEGGAGKQIIRTAPHTILFPETLSMHTKA